MPLFLHWLLFLWFSLAAPLAERAGDAAVAWVRSASALVPVPDPRAGGDPRPTLEEQYPQLLGASAQRMLTGDDLSLLRRELAAFRELDEGEQERRAVQVLETLAAQAQSSFGRELAAHNLGRFAAKRGDWEEVLTQARTVLTALGAPHPTRDPAAVRRRTQYARAEEARALLALGRTEEAAAVTASIPADGAGEVGGVGGRQALMKRVGLLLRTRGAEEAQQALFSASPPADDAAAARAYVNAVDLYATQLGVADRLAAAAAVYRTLLNRYPGQTDSTVFYNAAAAFDKTGEGELARGVMRAAAERFPSDSAFSYAVRDRADAAAVRGDVAEELRWVELQLETLPADSGVRRGWLGHQRQLLGKVDGKDLRPVPRADPLPPAGPDEP